MSFSQIQSLCNNKMIFENCVGSLKNQNKEYKVTNAKIYLSDKNTVIMEGICEDRFVAHETENDFSGIFKDENNRIITFEKLAITNINNASTTSAISFKAKIISSTISTESISQETEITIYIILTTIKFCGNESIIIDNENVMALNKCIFSSYHQFDMVSYNFEGIANSTGYIEFTTTMEKWESEWKKKIFQLYYILSFSASNFISMPIIYFISTDGNYKIELHSATQETGRGHSIFYLEYPGVMHNIISSVYSNYLKYHNLLDLNKLFHYYIMMKNTFYLENSYLLGCIFMEGLKHSYAKNYKKYEIDKKGFFKKSNKKKYSFKELIKQVYTEFKLHDGDEEFIQYRNEVIHQGSINLSFPNLYKQKEQLETTIEKLLLNILDFKGELYWDKVTKKWIEY